MKKVEGWMETSDFKHEVGDTEHGSPCYVHSTKEGCLAHYPSIENGSERNRSIEITRVYILDADEYEQDNPSLKEALPVILALINDPEFCKNTLGGIDADFKDTADIIFKAFKKAAYGDL